MAPCDCAPLYPVPGFGPTELLMVDFTTGIHLEDKATMAKLIQVVGAEPGFRY